MILSPLTKITGWNIWQCWVDMLHTLDMGLLRNALASVLVELARRAVNPQAPAQARRNSQPFHRPCSSRALSWQTALAVAFQPD